MPSPEFVGDLPEDGRKTGGSNRKHRDLAEALRTKPGDWAKWPFTAKPTSLHSIAGNINKGRSKAFPSNEFEAAYRQGGLYIRARPHDKWLTLDQNDVLGIETEPPKGAS